MITRLPPQVKSTKTYVFFPENVLLFAGLFGSEKLLQYMRKISAADFGIIKLAFLKIQGNHQPPGCRLQRNLI